MADRIPQASEGNGYNVLGYLREAVEESDNFLKGQFGYDKIQTTLDAVVGEKQDLRSSLLSSVNCNLTGKAFTDLVAGLTDVKPFWEYRTYNKKFEVNTAIYGKLSTHNWIQRGMGLNFTGAVQYALAGGCSYFEPYWDSDDEDFKAEAWDPRDVLPIRPTTSPSIQDCYGVITRKAMTVNEARHRCSEVFKRPVLAQLIQATSDGSLASSQQQGRAAKLVDRLLGQWGSPFQQRLFGDKARRDIPRIPTVDWYVGYFKDGTRNESVTPVHMGDWHSKPTAGCMDPSCITGMGLPHAVNNWSYVVEKGEKLYPRKRTIVWCGSLPEPIYDGPSPWWHGMFPYPKLSLDYMVNSWLGHSPMWDILPLNKFLNKMLRVGEDWAEQLARPMVIADKNSVSQHMLTKFDTRKAGAKLRINPVAGKGVQIVPPPPLPADYWRFIEQSQTWINELSGQADLSRLAALNQIPSSDTIEKLTQGMSLSWKGRSRIIETFMSEFGAMMAYNFAQFYTLPRRLTILGAQGATPQDWDFDPGSLVPDFVHSEDFDENGVTADALRRGPLPRLDRAQEFLRQFTTHIAPGSLLSSSEVDRQMRYLQLARANLIDPWTLYEVLAIPNSGNPPPGANTIPERIVAAMEMGLMMNTSPAGRKAAGDQPPRMASKDGGTRPTVTES